MPEPVGERPNASGSGIAIEAGNLDLAEVMERAKLAEAIGLDSVWFTQLPAMRDSASLLAAAAVRTERIRLGAGILPYYTRPPVVLAQTALTVDELSGGRFALGVGTGHRLTAEWGLGVPLGPPVASMREYLTVVTSLIRDGEVQFDGEWYKSHSRYGSPRRADLPTYLGALGPQMCRLAGEVADGLLLWMCTADYVAQVALPHLAEGLRRAGRDRAGFPVIAVIPGAVSDDPDTDVEHLRKYLSAYARVPNYRRMYEASGYGAALRGREIGDDLLHAVGVIGKPEEVSARVAEFRQAGADEVVVTPMSSAHYDRESWQRTAEAVRC